MASSSRQPARQRIWAACWQHRQPFRLSVFLDGLDSLLSIVQMPSGIPVATVGVNGAENAAILAVQMLALSEPELASKLDAFKAEMAQKVEAKDAKIRAQFAK